MILGDSETILGYSEMISVILEWFLLFGDSQQFWNDSWWFSNNS